MGLATKVIKLLQTLLSRYLLFIFNYLKQET